MAASLLFVIDMNRAHNARALHITSDRSPLLQDETEPTALVTICTKLIAQDSGVATVEFCNYGLQSVAKEEQLYKQRAVGPVHTKMKSQNGKYISPNLSANSLCSKIPQGGT